MWQLYGQNGVALRTTLKSLSRVLDSNSSQNWLASSINYIDRNRPLAELTSWGGPEVADWVRRPFLVKRKEYSHEEEVRLETVDAGGRRGIILKDLDPEKWIEGIVFWPGFPRSEAEALVSAISKLAPRLADRTKSSPLFQRDPTSTFPTALDALDEYFADRLSSEAQSWPEFLRRP